MNLAGDNALGYLEISTEDGLKGVGWSFTNGQGNEYVDELLGSLVLSVLTVGQSVLCTAIRSLARRLVNRRLADFTSNMRKTQRSMVSGVIRFMSPERGVLQLASCAVLNAIWDLWVS
jgi:hypothetical protein